MTKNIETSEKTLNSIKVIYFMKEVENEIVHFNKNYRKTTLNEKKYAMKEIKNKLRLIESNYL